MKRFVELSYGKQIPNSETCSTSLIHIMHVKEKWRLEDEKNFSLWNKTIIDKLLWALLFKKDNLWVKWTLTDQA